MNREWIRANNEFMDILAPATEITEKSVRESIVGVSPGEAEVAIASELAVLIADVHQKTDDEVLSVLQNAYGTLDAAQRLEALIDHYAFYLAVETVGLSEAFRAATSGEPLALGGEGLGNDPSDAYRRFLRDPRVAAGKASTDAKR